MIEIVEIALNGRTAKQAFRGVLSFQSGLQVLVGPNRFGKSLAFSGLAWCLGVEQIFGAQTSDASIFADAARRRLLLDGHEEDVIESSASVVLRRQDGATLKLRRGITHNVGTIAYDDGEQSGNLIVGRGSMTDATAGFQSTFRKWADLPDVHLLSSRGAEVSIYLENLAPLFLIEQLAGWSDVQAEQVHRYGTIEVDEGAFEYLLGLDDTLAARHRNQNSSAVKAALREEARSVSSDYVALMQKQGWEDDLSTVGSLDAIVARWREIDLVEHVREKFRFDARAEIARAAKHVETLRSRITKEKVDTDSIAETTAVSAQVVTIKQERHEAQSALAILRAQLREQHSLLNSIEGRLRSARDLYRLKIERVGILPKAECPTCHQSVDPAHMDLSEQSAEAIEVHVEQLDRERRLLKASTDHLRAEILGVATRARRYDEELMLAEQSLKLVNLTIGPARETLVKLSGDLVAGERELQRNRDLATQLASVQARMKEWLSRAVDVSTEAPEPTEEKDTLAKFVTDFRRYVVDLGCAGIPASEAHLVAVDERYVPTYGKRLLRALGSASDRARLVTAYVLALSNVGSRHLGFAVLDEPLQQNPDGTHRQRFIDFLVKDASSLLKQTIIFTALNVVEVETLQRSGIAVQVLEGRFLRAIPPSPPGDAGRAEASSGKEVIAATAHGTAVGHGSAAPAGTTGAVREDATADEVQGGQVPSNDEEV